MQAHLEEVLARRMLDAPVAVQRVLQVRLEQARTVGRDSASANRAPPPQERLQQAPSPLARLNQELAAAALPDGGLRSARGFLEVWSRNSAEDEVTRAVAQGPENAGPLNSHRLVLRTLALMRDLSPDYLRRFLSHADTLLWLEQAQSQSRPKPHAARSRPVRAKK